MFHQTLNHTPADLSPWEEDCYEGDSAAYWKTAEGEILAITDMLDTHLLNSLRFVWRQRENLLDGYDWHILPARHQGKTALYSMLQLAFVVPQWENLLREAERRKLLTPHQLLSGWYD